jgi:UDP-glucose 4-epimerase
MRIGITGGLGVIGQALSNELRKKNIDFVLMDNARSGEFFGDINNKDDLEKLFYNCDGIVHLASVSSVRVGELDSHACYQTNVLGTLNIIDYISMFNPPKWLLFISSREVYGKQQKYPITEGTKCTPINQYGLSKLLAEDLVKSKCQRLNINYAILRLSNVYGIQNDLPERVIPKFFHRAIKGEELVVFGEKTTCDFVHIQDVIASFITTIEKLQNNRCFSTLNICSGEETRLIELANIIIKLTGSTSRIRTLTGASYNVDRFVGSNTKAATQLGWLPEIILNQGLKMYHEDMKKALNENIKGNTRISTHI